MAKLVAAGLILALAGPSLAESSSPDPVQAAPALWEWERAEFNAIVRVRPEDLKPLQQRLARTKDPGERRAISILLSLNCALPPQSIHLAGHAGISLRQDELSELS